MKRLLSTLYIFLVFLCVNAQENDSQFLKEFVYPEFVRYEATYRNQKIVIPRSSVAKPVTLGNQLEQIFGNTSEFTDAYVCIGSWDGISDTLYLSPKQLFDMDPIMLAYGAGSNGLIKKYEEPNVAINLGYLADDGNKRYMTIFMRVRGFLNREMYARMTIMYPGKDVDDCTTYTSNSAPFVGSYVTAFDANPEQVAMDMIYYDSVDATLRAKLESNEKLDNMEYRLLEGVYETSIEAYDDDYAMWMYNDKRYNDACQFFEKAYLANRADILSGDKTQQELFYRSCYYIGDCLNKIGISDKAQYFFGLSALNGGEYAQTYSKLQNAKITPNELHNYQFVDGNKSDLNIVSVGQILRSIYDVIPEYILGGSLLNGGIIGTKNLTPAESWDIDIKSLCSIAVR